MGLDMSLYKMTRFKNVEPTTIMGISSYFDWLKAKEEGSEYANCTLKEWCGVEEKDIPKDAIEFYKPFYIKRYWSWDTNCKYGHMMIEQEVAYWRKANHIHNWFVENVQDGEDDCGIYEVSKEQLEDLLNVCKLVKVNPAVAPEYLPTTSGFFFGSTDYDEYYMQDIEYTIEVLDKVLKETDFEKQMIAYGSSW